MQYTLDYNLFKEITMTRKPRATKNEAAVQKANTLLLKAVTAIRAIKVLEMYRPKTLTDNQIDRVREIMQKEVDDVIKTLSDSKKEDRTIFLEVPI
jgi:hypothetical protein